MSGNKLTALPENLPFHLKILDVSRNQLTALPNNLPLFLTELYAGFNELVCLPDRLPFSLQMLDVNNNKLTTLPAQLPIDISVIDVKHNQLRELPCVLPLSLSALDASHNHLTCLPADLPNALETLDVNYNNLTALPAQLPALLDKLYVNYNQLTELPSSLPLTLKLLCAHHNQLTDLPEDLLDFLDASDNQLTHLPSCLPDLYELHVDNNRLVALPENLPRALTELYASGNRLTRLPDELPPSLEEINVHDNQITQLPAMLPDDVCVLDVSGNLLTTLPAVLPSSLEILYAGHNQLIELPDHLPLLLQLHVENNRLTHLSSTLPNSLELLNVSHNPLTALPDNWSSLPMPIGLNNTLVFLEKLLCWDEDIDTKKWNKIRAEDNADTFADFLATLHQGENRGHGALRQRICDWLSYLAQDTQQALRVQTFALAQEAAESCVDRASFYFNNMHILMVEHQIISTNVPLEQVLDTMLGLFRLQILEQIAAKKVADRQRESPGFSEDLEVYFAYQYGLREPLALPIYTQLQFADIAALSRDDMVLAYKEVKAREKCDFLCYWFTESALWTAVLEKWNAEKKAAMEERYLEAISAAPFKQAVLQELTEKILLIDDTDAEREISSKLAAALFYQLREALTRECLESFKALSLLDRFTPRRQSGILSRYLGEIRKRIAPF